MAQSYHGHGLSAEVVWTVHILGSEKWAKTLLPTSNGYTFLLLLIYPSHLDQKKNESRTEYMTSVKNDSVEPSKILSSVKYMKKLVVKRKGQNQHFRIL